jgi:hypothetical protein
MQWTVVYHPAFDPEYEALPQAVQDELVESAILLQVLGPRLRRPHVDTLAGLKHANMKELRFQADDGVWRVASDKAGVAQKRFYKALIAKADKRFSEHLDTLEGN